MFYHPVLQSSLNFSSPAYALLQQLGGHHRHVSASHDCLDHILGGVDTRGEGEIGLDMPV